MPPQPPPRLENEIVFSSDRGGVPKLFRMAPDGSGVVEVPTPGLTSVTRPDVGPNGEWIAFAGKEQGPAGLDIWVVRPDGTGLQNLTMKQSQQSRPAWSPDGTVIAYTSNEVGPCCTESDIFVMNRDGSNVRRITTAPGSDDSASWSPDGSMLVFSSVRSGNYDLFIVRLDGSAPVPLSPHPEVDVHPRWSPDGTKIAFKSFRAAGAGSGIFLVAPDGSALMQVPLTFDNPGIVAWKPDGSMLVLEQNGSNDIWVVEPDGGGLQNITNSPATFDLGPSWSP